MSPPTHTCMVASWCCRCATLQSILSCKFRRSFNVQSSATSRINNGVSQSELREHLDAALAQVRTLQQSPINTPIRMPAASKHHGPRLSSPPIPTSRKPLSLQSLASLFVQYDTLQEVLGCSLPPLGLPPIIVVGTTGSGKSSLLQRLTMLPIFPQDGEICTRLPIRLCFQHRREAAEPRLEVYNIKEHRTMHSFAIPLDKGSQAVKAAMVSALSLQHGQLTGVSSDVIINVYVTGPDYPTLTVIDMPGLLSAPAAGEPEDIATQTATLLETQISKKVERPICLAVIKATENPSATATMGFLHRLGLRGQTCGVFTFCDSMSNADKQRLERWLKAGPSHGRNTAMGPSEWVATMNAPVMKWNSSEMDWLHQQATAEVDFFKSQGMEALMDAGTVGSNALVNCIHEMINDHLQRNWLPSVQKALDEQLAACDKRSAALGLPAGLPMPGVMPWDLRRQRLQDMAIHVVTSALAEGNSNVHSAHGMAIGQTLRGKIVTALERSCVGLDVKPPTWRSVTGELAVSLPTHMLPHWYALRQQLLGLVEVALQEDTAFWHIWLIQRISQVDSAMATSLSTAPFRMERFPKLKSMLDRAVDDVMRDLHADVLVAVNGLLDKFFREDSPWVTYQLAVTKEAPCVHITCHPQHFEDALLFCIHRHSTAAVPSHLAAHWSVVVREVEDWVETCAAERLEFERKRKALAHAQEILASIVGQDTLGQNSGTQAKAVAQMLWDRYAAAAALHDMSLSCAEPSLQAQSLTTLVQMMTSAIDHYDTSHHEVLDVLANKICSARAVQTIIDVMRLHIGSHVIQWSSCCLLCFLCLSPTTRQAVLGAEGAAALVAAMRQHSENADVQEVACRALVSLAQDKTAQHLVVKEGAVAVVLQMMQHNADHTGCQEAACAAVQLLSQVSDGLSQLVEGGGIHLTFRAIRRHPAHNGVQLTGCGALRHLACTERNIMFLIDEGAIGTLRATRDNKGLSPAVHQAATQALRALEFDATGLASVYFGFLVLLGLISFL